METYGGPAAPGDPGETEPRYRRMLEQDRPHWTDPRLFEHYRRHYHSEVDRGRFILATLHRHVPGFDPDGARVLDIGCGDAGVPIAFARAGARATGIEPAPRNPPRGRVRAADHGVPVGLARAVGEALPFPSASFDLVVLDNVLEHVTDREATLTEIGRVLAPQGLLYMVTPKPLAIQHLLADPHYGTSGLVLLPRPWQRRIVERRFGPGSYDVGRIPTRRWLRRALRRHGFEPLVPPRDLWVEYVRERIARPEEVRPGLKRRLAEALTRRPWVFGNPLVRWGLDVGLGANIFLARKSA